MDIVRHIIESCYQVLESSATHEEIKNRFTLLFKELSGVRIQTGKEQQKLIRVQASVRALLHAYTRLQARHKQKIKDIEDMKAMLTPAQLVAWDAVKGQTARCRLCIGMPAEISAEAKASWHRGRHPRPSAATYTQAHRINVQKGHAHDTA